MSKTNISLRVEEAERDFVDKVAAHYGVTRAEVLATFYFAGKRQFVAKLRAMALVNRLKEAKLETVPAGS